MAVVRRKSYYCGNRHLECEMFLASGHAYQHRKPRNKTGNRTSAKQYRSNWHNSLKKLRRIVKSNFTTGNDWYLGMTYNDNFLPSDDEAAISALRDFKERLQGMCERRNIDCRLLGITERGKLHGRLHHHVFANGDIPLELIRKAWSKKLVKENGWPKESMGKIHIDKVPTDVDNLECLSEYTLKCPIGRHKWVYTRNLIQPEVEIDDNVVSYGEFVQLGYGGYDRNEMYLMLSRIYPDYTPIDYDGIVIEALNNSPYMTASLEVKHKSITVGSSIKKWCDKYGYVRDRNCRYNRNRNLTSSAVNRWIIQNTDKISILNKILNEDWREFMIEHMNQFIHNGMSIDRATEVVDREVASGNRFSHVLLSHVGEAMRKEVSDYVERTC